MPVQKLHKAYLAYRATDPLPLCGVKNTYTLKFAREDADVTCKTCIKIMETQNSRRY